MPTIIVIKAIGMKTGGRSEWDLNLLVTGHVSQVDA